MSPILECQLSHSNGYRNFEYDDDQMKEAAAKAERDGCVRPLILHELKTKIQLSRVKQGKHELVLQPELPKVYELTEEEKVKQNKRKNRNRQAAKASRLKKKDQHVKLQKENEALSKRQNHLKNNVKRLQEMLGNLKKSVTSSKICHQSYYSSSRRHSSYTTVENSGLRPKLESRYSLPWPVVVQHPGLTVIGPLQRIAAQENIQTSEGLMDEDQDTAYAANEYEQNELMGSLSQQFFPEELNESIYFLTQDQVPIVEEVQICTDSSPDAHQMEPYLREDIFLTTMGKHAYRSAASSPAFDSGSLSSPDGSSDALRFSAPGIGRNS